MPYLLAVVWREAGAFVDVHYSIFLENTVNNSLNSYILHLILSVLMPTCRNSPFHRFGKKHTKHQQHKQT